MRRFCGHEVFLVFKGRRRPSLQSEQERHELASRRNAGRRTSTEYILQPHLVRGNLPLDHCEDEPATLFARRTERFRYFWYLCRHQVLRLLS